MKRCVLVTGADRGLGLELVKEFERRGFYVFAGKFLSKWNLLETYQAQHPDTVQIVDLDVTSIDSVKAAREQVLGKTDKLDILVNNAGVAGGHGGTDGTIFDENLDFDNMLRTFNVNALGALRMANAFIQMILASDHKLIVNISSEAGSIGTCWRYNGFGYCMSKAALNMHSAIIHNSLHRQYNGQVMDFNPGGMVTDLADTKADDEMKHKERSHTLFPAATCEEAAKGIVECVMNQEEYKSDHPAFLTRNGRKIPW